MLTDQWFIRGGVEMEWFPEDMKIDVGPSQVRVDLSNVSGSVGVGRHL
jgi:hypothetical protein